MGNFMDYMSSKGNIMEDLKVGANLPNTKECANTATGVLRDLIRKHNLVVDKLIKAEQKISELQQDIIFNHGQRT